MKKFLTDFSASIPERSEKCMITPDACGNTNANISYKARKYFVSTSDSAITFMNGTIM